MLRLFLVCLMGLTLMACETTQTREIGGSTLSAGNGGSSIGPVDFDTPLGVVDRNARRSALVIGNSAYRSLGALANPKNDARLMAQTFKSLGFDVQSGGAMVDLSASQMRAAIAKYRSDLARRGGVGAVYFAGHAVQIDGRNWLAPVDAAPSSFSDLRTQFVAADNLLQAGAPKGVDLNLVLLDACRDNPFVSRAQGRSTAINDPKLRSVSAGRRASRPLRTRL